MMTNNKPVNLFDPHIFYIQTNDPEIWTYIFKGSGAKRNPVVTIVQGTANFQRLQVRSPKSF